MPVPGLILGALRLGLRLGGGVRGGFGGRRGRARLLRFFRRALGFLPFGEGAAGLAVSRCNMFFKPLRSDFGRFSAMRALGKNVTPFYYNGIAQEE
jgi:hypothetical protein